MLERERHGPPTGSHIFRLAGHRRRLRAGALALIAASAGLTAFAAAASASGSAQGPPAGPKSPPFTQCPAIGHDSTCEYLIDVTSTDPSVPPTVVRDSTQRPYDGTDDATVAFQNDTAFPLESVHVGVLESGDHEFAFDGDGLCSEAVSPKPTECPFGPSLGDPFDYLGPDTAVAIESADAGTVFFPTPLRPGQYTYITLEAAPNQAVVAGQLNDIVSTVLTNTETLENGDALVAPSPVSIRDQATIKGPNAAEATGTVEYVVYSDPNCRNLVERLGTKQVKSGIAGASDPSSGELQSNLTYYWLVRYSGDGHNSPNTSACGSETMTFGTPPSPPQPAITTVLSGGGQMGTHITVTEGTAVTDTAIITSPHGQPVTGRVTYAAYASAQCTGRAVAGLGGGVTTGTGPSTNAVTLEVGKYYFQAFYSGSSALKSASTLCGDEVLTVVPNRPLPPAAQGSGPRTPSSQFHFVGGPHVNGTVRS